MAFSTSTYQAVPTEVDIDLEANGFKPAEQEVQLTQRTVQPVPRQLPVQFKPKKAFFRILTAITVMYGVYYGLTRLGAVRFGRRCVGGAHRNISTKLYTLPSGDKIPGIALGAIQSQASGPFTGTDKGLVKVFGVLILVELEMPSRSGWFLHIVGRSICSRNAQTALRAGYRHIDGAWIYGVSPMIEVNFAFAHHHGRTKLKSVSR